MREHTRNLLALHAEQVALVASLSRAGNRRDDPREIELLRDQADEARLRADALEELLIAAGAAITPTVPGQMQLLSLGDV